MSRRVILSAYFDPALSGGGNQYSSDLARVWLKQGKTVHVLCNDRRRNLLDLEPYRADGRLVIHPICDYNRILLSHVFDARIHEAARKIIADVRPELIHVHNIHGLLGAVWAAVESGVKTAYTALDFGLLCQSWYLYDGSPEPCSGPAPGKCAPCLARQHKAPFIKKQMARLPFLVRLLGKDPGYTGQYALLDNYYAKADESLKKMVPLLGRFDAIFVISPGVGEILAKHGAPRERIHYTPQGANFEKPPEDLKNGEDGIRFTFLGHMAPIKGFHIVARALEGLPSDLKLKIHVYGDDSRHFVQRCSSAARRFLVCSEGLIGMDVERELMRADATLIPSLWHENTPYAVLRALAAGRPVVSADQAGISHLITHGRNGWLLPPGDVAVWREALTNAARNPELLRRMRPNCRYDKTIEDYSMELERVLTTI